MTWTNTTANAEQWGELATGDEIQLFDESSNVLLDEGGNELVIAGVNPWALVSASPEVWTGA